MSNRRLSCQKRSTSAARGAAVVLRTVPPLRKAHSSKRHMMKAWKSSCNQRQPKPLLLLGADVAGVRQLQQQQHQQRRLRQHLLLPGRHQPSARRQQEWQKKSSSKMIRRSATSRRRSRRRRSHLYREGGPPRDLGRQQQRHQPSQQQKRLLRSHSSGRGVGPRRRPGVQQQ